MSPHRTWRRQVLRALRRKRREEIYERTKLLDRDLEVEDEEEYEEEYEPPAPAYQQAALPQVLSPDTRRAALFAIFDEMAEQRNEFRPDGRPRVEKVNERLSARGQQASATRKEIDEAFAAWQQGHVPDAS